MAPFLEFLSTLIWQAIVLAALVLFRSQIVALFERIGSFRVGEAEFQFQDSAADAMSPGGKAEDELRAIDEAGFFTAEGMQRIVDGSGVVSAGEVARQTLLLFRTAKQRTWLVATSKQLFCILDDSRTRASSRLIQWRLKHAEVKAVRARFRSERTGLLDVGPRKNWLYSSSLHPDPDGLEADVLGLLGAKEKK